MPRICDKDIIKELNSRLGTPSNTKITIEPIDETSVKFADHMVLHGVLDILSPRAYPYYLNVLLDSRNAEPRGELWKIYNGFFRFLNIFRNWDYSQRNFGHGMHFDETHEYFQGLCYEYFYGHTEQCFILSNDGSLKRYRDHAAHMCRVGGIGSILLRSGLLNRPEVNDYAKRNKFTLEDVKTIWWCASLLHDIGYLWELVLKMLNNPEDKTDFVKQVRRYILSDEYLYYLCTSKYQPGGFYKDEDFYETAHEKFLGLQEQLSLSGRSWDKHEVLGACLLWLHQKELGINCSSTKLSIRQLVLSEVLRIISQHHSSDNKPHSPVAFSEDPLGFLLILCDEAQEWGRPLKTDYGIWACESTGIEFNIDDNFLQIVIDYTDENVLSIAGFNKEYFEQGKQKALSRLEAPFEFSVVGNFGN